MEKEKEEKNVREAFLVIVGGGKGSGKTWLNMHVIADYVKDKIQNNVRGSNALIIDSNGEYTKEQFARNGIPNFEAKKIALKDVPKFSLSKLSEARRIDIKNLSIKEKLQVMEYAVQNFRNGLIVLEDINNITLSVTHLEAIVSVLISARHRGLDMLVSYQSLRAVEPRIWQNANLIRLHKTIDNVSDIKGKVPNPEILKIAQLIVELKYHSGSKRFYLFVNQNESKIEGVFSEKDFEDACLQYLNINKKMIKEYMNMHRVSQEESIKANVGLLKERYLS
jgi:hypothetical protein